MEIFEIHSGPGCPFINAQERMKGYCHDSKEINIHKI